MGGMVKGKSDPYVRINIGGAVFKSHVIKENLNPTWNEMYEVRCVFSWTLRYFEDLVACAPFNITIPLCFWTLTVGFEWGHGQRDQG